MFTVGGGEEKMRHFDELLRKCPKSFDQGCNLPESYTGPGCITVFNDLSLKRGGKTLELRNLLFLFSDIRPYHLITILFF